MARPAATGEHKARAARQMRATAARLDSDHPEMMAGDHLRDAAKVLEHGSTDGAKRHLDAAMFMLTPQSLVRHGIRDDDGHADAKHHMHQINRHRLNVEDIEDIHARNDRLRAVTRARRGEAPTDDDEIQEARLAAAASAPGSVIDLRAAWIGEKRNMAGMWTGGSPGKGEARRFAAMFGPPAKGHQHGGAAKASALAALGTTERRVYDKLRKRGVKHSKALKAATMDRMALNRSLAGALAGGLANGGPAVELAGPYRYKHGWISLLGIGSATAAAAKGAGMPLETRKAKPRAPAGFAPVADAGHLDGKLAHGVTSAGQQVRGYYDHSRGRVTPRHGGAVPVRYVRAAASEAPVIQHGKRPKYPPMRRASFLQALRAVTAGKAMEAAGTGPAIHLAFNPAEPRDRRGRWRGRGSVHPFGAGVKPGSFEHLKAIEELAERAGSVPGVPERNSPTMKTSLYHLARSVAQRDMKGAQIHLDSAKWANRHGRRHLVSAPGRLATAASPGAQGGDRLAEPARPAQRADAAVPAPGQLRRRPGHPLESDQARPAAVRHRQHVESCDTAGQVS